MQNDDISSYFRGLLLLLYLLFAGGLFQLSAVSCLLSLTFPSLGAPAWDPVSASAFLLIESLHSMSMKLKCEQNVSESKKWHKNLNYWNFLGTSNLSLLAFFRAGFYWSPCRASGPTGQQPCSNFSAVCVCGTASHRPQICPTGPIGMAGTASSPHQWLRRCRPSSEEGGGWLAWSPLAPLHFFWVQFKSYG